ncbi:hypothetical protein AB0C52_25275 [Streptomyces sp. NPDC048717]|uniref:GNAT family N-acetyltransferase n=1 Tax=Streptomyces sp. NPDC048717 TaxID=3154928 RepID=UPI003447DF4E
MTVHLPGPGLALREVRPDDTADLLAIYGDPEATRHLSFEPRTREQVQATTAIEACERRPLQAAFVSD